MVHNGIEFVAQLIRKYKSSKGIYPIDEEVLIQFSIDGKKNENIEKIILENFLVSRETVLLNRRSTLLQQSYKSIPVEPRGSRPLTADEITLSKFLQSHRNNVSTLILDPESTPLVEKYLKGTIGVIPPAAPMDIFGQFRFFQKLIMRKNERIFTEFLCAGLSWDELWSILVRRYGSLDTKPADKQADDHAKRVTRGPRRCRPLDRIQILDLVSRMKIRNHDLAYCLLLAHGLVKMDKEPHIPLKRMDITVQIFEDIGRVEIGERELGFVIKSVAVEAIEGIDQVIVCDDTGHLRIGPGTLNGYMWCEKYFEIIFPKKFDIPRSLQVSVKVMDGPFCPIEVKEMIVKSSVWALAKEVEESPSQPVRPQSASRTIPPRTDQCKRPKSALPVRTRSVPQVRPKSAANAVRSLVPRRRPLDRSATSPPKEGRENPPKRMEVSQEETVSNKPSKRRMCLRWVEFGVCEKMNCLYAHSLEERI